MIRAATVEDVLDVVDMVVALRTAVKGPVPIDRSWTAQSVAKLIASPNGAVWISKGGFIAACLVQTIISPVHIAQEAGWWATDGTGVRLLREFEKWADERGAFIKQISTAPDGMDMARLGYRKAELAWVK